MPRKEKNSKGKGSVNLIAYFNTKSPITEQYRQIRNNINFASVDKEIKSIVVTSPEPADGKSTTSANLAIVLAQQGKRVLLVDADLRKPSVHYAFYISNLEGLTSVLTKEKSIKDVISRTNIPNLDVLPCGVIPPNPSELLDSNAMETMINELKVTFDFVIFDTPPILAVPDSQIMANKCDGAILVVSSGKTRKEAAMKSKYLLEKANANMLGVVINGVDSKNGGYIYNYV
ncbi:CpsD/CapB family tyrosine-protein kinase [Bacillus sp. SORGH_AS_0510]|uniref:CpsD/CapB family tyrosine-protein kinase n=1 Tax=Bacillus sp. SORGH_AS_0510 TaxID=3041771 RepID=UPI0027D86908|nr:CpsD/CapB family tyrosine-protein kinase [Bacillus sp. SORGH_AS_0510]